MTLVVLVCNSFDAEMMQEIVPQHWYFNLYLKYIHIRVLSGSYSYLFNIQFVFVFDLTLFDPFTFQLSSLFLHGMGVNGSS
jgi:hypothetical protein